MPTLVRANRRRPSSGGRGVGDAAPYGWLRDEGCSVQRDGCYSLTHTNGARSVPAGLHTLGGGREVNAPWVTRVLSVTLNGCV